MAAPASALLLTKLNRPPVTPDWVARPRLIEQLNHSLQRGPLTLVCASAGFGKTTLVSSWIEGLTAGRGEGTGGVTPPLRAAWLSLDESDSDLVLFLQYFVAAIRTVFPKSCAETLALLRAPNPTAQASLVTVLGNELERLPARMVLVLDDYYAIRDSTVHDYLSELLRHWPQRLHLVLISRSNPPLPLASLRAKGQVVEIRTRDLRFTPHETAAFTDKVLAAPLSPSALALLDERLEGWIAGLRLVTLSLGVGANAESDLADLSGTHFEIADYLVDEVMACQTPAILRFLLATSILDRFCAPLCEWVLGGASASGGGGDGSNDPPCDAQASIQWLERNNLFVVPLDDDRQWHRYHHLFRELLHRKLLDEASPEQVTRLHRRAADWFAGHGLIDDALRHARAINDLDLPAQLMVAGLCDALNREDRATLDRWLRMVPDEFIQRHPWLLMIKAIAFGLSWQLAASWRVLDQIEALLAEGPREEAEPPLQKDEGNERPLHGGDSYDLSVLRGIIATLRGQEAYSRGQADRAIAYSEEALALLPSRWSYVRGIAVVYWGLGMQATGRGDAAERMLLDEYEGLRDKTDSYALRLLFAACFNAIEAGRLEQARRLALTMLDQAMSSRLPYIMGFAHYFLGVVHYYWNELDAAGQYLGQPVAERQIVHTQGARNGMVGLTWVHVARGEIAAARAIVELLSQFDLDRLGQDGDDTRSLRAQLEYLQGDAESALRWADGYTAPVVGRSLLWLQNPHLAKARILLARGAAADMQAALDILKVLLEFAERTFNVRVQIEVLALRALALEKQGKTADALAALQQAVELARPGGFIRVFVDLGPPMQSMLLGLAERGFAHLTGNVRRLLAAFSEPQKKVATGDAGARIRAANARLVEPLTDRELDVLALLREHLSNKEIAHRLCLSPLTVKRYTVNLYGKLGVNKRWDAVAEAESLGILPPR
jgi:LuxR family maltose regulon positive regulatory protein